MNILVWNRQGIANRRTRHALKLLIHKHQINLVFCVKLDHCTRAQHKTLPHALGLPHVVHFDRVNRARGVALLWDDSIQINVRQVEFFFIDIDLLSLGMDPWRFMGFYEHSETSQRHFS